MSRLWTNEGEWVGRQKIRKQRRAKVVKASKEMERKEEHGVQPLTLQGRK